MLDLPQPDRASMIELNRTRLRVWEWGSVDDPPLICVHGAFDHGRMWDGFAPKLAARGFRVVAPDLRGHGDSGRLTSGHAWSACALDLRFLVRELGGSAGLVGHSFGGGQAMFVAAAWPAAIPWVVALDALGPTPSAFEDRDPVEIATAGFDALDRIRSRPPRIYPSKDEMVARRAAVNGRLPRAWVEHLVEHGAAPADGGFVWKSDPVFNVGFGGPFRAEHLEVEHSLVRSPLLVLTGGEVDTWSELTEEQIDERLANLPDARHEVIEDAGHYIHVEQPDRCLEAMDRFHAEVAS